MRSKYFVSGISGTSKPQAVITDLRHDVARGILSFANADTPVATDILPDVDDEVQQLAAVDTTADEPHTPLTDAGDDRDDIDSTKGDSHSDENEADNGVNESGGTDGFTPLYSPSSDRPWTGRLRGHRASKLSTTE